MPTHEPIPDGAPCWIELFTSDAAAARTFYGELFGWTASDAPPEYGGYFNFSKDGRMVAGCMPNDGSQGAPDAWTVYLGVTDAEATAAAVTANGGQVYVPPMQVMHLGTMAFVADAGQAAVGVWQPDAHKGFELVGEPGAPAWFELFTRDYDATLAFYRAVFGWDLHTAEDGPEFRYSTLGEGPTMTAGIMDAGAFLPDGVPAHWSVYFATGDADASAARVAELGGTVTDGPEDTPYGRLATATDPTGTRFKLIQLPS